MRAGQSRAEQSRAEQSRAESGKKVGDERMIVCNSSMICSVVVYFRLWLWALAVALWLFWSGSEQSVVVVLNFCYMVSDYLVLVLVPVRRGAGVVEKEEGCWDAQSRSVPT